MAIRAVVFDWGGTLTPWHDVDLVAQWYAYAEVYDPVGAASLARRLSEREDQLWRAQRESHGAAGNQVGLAEHGDAKGNEQGSGQERLRIFEQRVGWGGSCGGHGTLSGRFPRIVSGCRLAPAGAGSRTGCRRICDRHAGCHWAI